MTGGGLYSAGHGSREYPGYELTNSVRVLPHLLLSVFLSGEPYSSVIIAEQAELIISRTVCCMI